MQFYQESDYWLDMFEFARAISIGAGRSPGPGEIEAALELAR